MFQRDARFWVVVAAWSIAACSKGAPKGEPTPAAQPAAPAPTETKPAAPYVSEEKARKEFVTRCVSCHGMEGKGDGPGAAALNPKPRNYTDKEWQKTVTDEQIGNTIMYGGAAVGKSPIMPAHPDLQSKPEMVAALVKVVRAFGK